MDDEKWDGALDMAAQLAHVLRDADYAVAMNALLLVVAHGGADSTLSKQEFLSTMVEQVGSMYDAVKQGEKTWRQ